MTNKELNDYNDKWQKLSAMIKLGMAPVQLDFTGEWNKLAKTNSHKKQPVCYMTRRK